eukprot:2125646-Pleurochrysis_carterae.AAC.1
MQRSTQAAWDCPAPLYPTLKPATISQLYAYHHSSSIDLWVASCRRRRLLAPRVGMPQDEMLKKELGDVE